MVYPPFFLYGLFEFNILKARQVADQSQQILAKPLMAHLSLSLRGGDVQSS